MASDEKTFLIDTGNIFNYGIIGPSVLKDPNCEVFKALECVLKCCEEGCARWESIKLPENGGEELQCLQVFEMPNGIQNMDRTMLKVSIKLFLYPEIFGEPEEYKKTVVEECIMAIQKILSITQIDNLILSIQTNDIDQVMPNLKSFWKLSEPFVADGSIRSLSCSDLNCEQLIELYNWSSTVKPFSTQINLDICCDIPADLSAFAKEHSIQLLTHNDPNDDFVPVDKLHKFMETKPEMFKNLINQNNKRLKRKWIARYTCVLPERAVVSTKGYLLSLRV